jgi:hypothetical protein
MRRKSKATYVDECKPVVMIVDHKCQQSLDETAFIYNQCNKNAMVSSLTNDIDCPLKIELLKRFVELNFKEHKYDNSNEPESETERERERERVIGY